MNIYDIAELAGVSIATVSRVISGNEKVKPATREKVEAVMKAYNYSPSMIARGMSSKSLKTVAIAVLSFSNPQHMRITHEIVKFFSKIDYNVVIYEAGASLDDILSFFSRMKDISIDGIILVSSVFSLIENNYNDVLRLIGDIPVIVANGWVKGMYGVLVDEDKGCFDAVEYLVSREINDIYYINSVHSDSSMRKCNGYRKAIAKHKKEEHLVNLSGTSDEDIDASLGQIDFQKGASAIICDEDVLAVHCTNYIKRIGLDIPKDVSIVGFNNSDYCSLSFPHLSSVDNNTSLLGQRCAEYLSIAMKGDCLGERRVLEHIRTELVLRESTL